MDGKPLVTVGKVMNEVLIVVMFSNGSPTPANRYAMKEWSHDRGHDKIYESKYLDEDPHGRKSK